MHLLLTDRLVCPRCGPEFGLILMAGRIEDRRVHEGRLGCFNCREEYPVERGVADLRPPPRDPPAAGGAHPPVDDAEGALRLAALLGVREGPGNLFLVGEPAVHAERIAAMIERIEVVVVHAGLEATEEQSGVSRIRIGNAIPVQPYAMRGVALGSGFSDTHLDEAVRVLAPGARLVLFSAPEGTRERLEARGFETLLATEGTLVFERD